MAEHTIARGFSKAARHYDANAHVQALVARDLLMLSRTGAPKTVLELGCGTGLYTRMLLGSFPEVTVQAVDISDAMVRVAREQIESPRASFLCADAVTFAQGRYDLVTSNASFHWFCDLACTIRNVRGMLNEGGVLTFSHFGPGTYRELRESLGCVTGSPIQLACSEFATASEIGSLLADMFEVHEVEEREYREDFASLRNLLGRIKLTGTRGVPPNLDVVWTRGLLRALEDTYLAHFGSIRATYQVYMCRAQR